ncbi:unnamed protein product [Cuscuta europaea]|uniref:Glycosyltransferase n=1 Tax=Cuscuta europaea TaxID=41803 RepID=A0A9P0Z848_CUSEU|nr:unnamed protein product [Cuscuta europaea]
MASERHVAVLAFPFATHPSLLFRLVRRIAAAEPDATFTFFCTAKSNARLFADQSPPPPGNIKRSDLADAVAESGGGLEDEIGVFLETAAQSFKNSVAAAEKESGKRFGCVVADAFMWFAQAAAGEMGVSWVPVWTSAAATLLLHLQTDLIRQTLPPGMGEREDERLTFIPGITEVRVGDIPGGIITGNLESPFAVMLHKMGRTLPKATAVAINSFQDLEPAAVNQLKTGSSRILNVGPFNVTAPGPVTAAAQEEGGGGCMAWLDGQRERSVAYIAFGTVCIPPVKELAAVAEAVEETKTPFLWSLREEAVMGLPEGFVERTKGYGKIVSWAPQVRVLGHGSVGVFVSHGGWNSVLESITAGVPLICRPFFGDHHMNSWMVENVWRIGARVESGVFTTPATKSALHSALRGTAFRTQAEAYRDSLRKAVSPNGTSTQDLLTLSSIITARR